MAFKDLRASLVVFFAFFASDAQAQVQDFLPSYYSEALTLNGRPIVFNSQGEQDGIKRAVFEEPGGSMSVAIDHLSCDRPQCTALLEQNLKRQTQRLSAGSGSFRSVSQSEYSAAWTEGGRSILLYFAKLPTAIEVWTRVTRVTAELPEESFLSGARRVTNRHRFDDARKLGNVDIGIWSNEILQYARDLKAAGKEAEALTVLAELIQWAPSNFEAQMDFAESTADKPASRASATAVWDNAEDEKLRARAARLLALSEPRLEQLPAVERGLQGLQIVLVPLPPADIRLIDEAAKLYASSFGVPVRIARLPNDWTWQTPQRVFRERDARTTIMQKRGATIDFAGWTKDRYASELASATVNDDPLTQYWIRDFLRNFAIKAGQYDVDPYLAVLAASLKPFRGDDRRTIFVAVTGADIFSGDTNFVFSTSTAVNDQAVSILSYARMLAAANGEPFESRRRVAQRLAKEMVPATLKQLGIPRPADPSDPYSYSSGLDRVDQKTLTLSTPTREALDRFRSP